MYWLKLHFWSIPLLLFAKLGRVNGSVSYQRDILPILSENCFYCHGQDASQRKAQLQLNTQEGQRSDNIVVPGKPEFSLLIERIVSSDPEELMPPPDSHRRLTATQKELVKRWIAEGANFEEHWAFLAPQRPTLPSSLNDSFIRHNAIDSFVLVKLHERGLKPSIEADKSTLLRRVSLDLTGLPPTLEELDHFLNDHSEEAYEKVVDRLLQSPRYGERMALPWLDAARYADSNGFQQDGDTHQWIWRDWVVDALNADQPFDQFSIEQLAGDLLPDATQEQIIATAFNRNHLINGEGGAIAEEQRNVILFDRVDVTSTTWLGLTMACAQCHDHKYDPITQKDYYSFMSAFNQVPETGGAGPGPGRIRSAAPFLELRTPQYEAELKALKDHTKNLITAFPGDWEKKRSELQTQWEDHLLKENLESENTWITLIKSYRSAPPDKPNNYAKNRLRREFDLFRLKLTPAQDDIKSIMAAKAAEESFAKDQLLKVMIMADSKARDTYILDRGDYLAPKEKVTTEIPEFLPALPKDLPRNRLGIAKWLFRPEHPLTARVQVNRMWQLFFGTGLVKTSEDLGVQSEIPIHQDLLDWLAVEFRESGWSTKHIHRLIVTSATYRQSSKISRESWEKDPENRSFSRATRFRLPSTLLRDLALSSSGLLDSRVGGQPVYPYQPEGIWDNLAITKERDFSYPMSTGDDLYRRSLYTFWRRTVAPANMFDAASRQTCSVKPNLTNTPLHALTTLNDPTWVDAAKALAIKLLRANLSDEARLNQAFRLITSREPNETQSVLLLQMMKKQLAYFQKNPKAATVFLQRGSEELQKSKMDPITLATWTSTSLGIFNLDSALTRE